MGMIRLGYNYQCENCQEYFIPYKKDIACPKCGTRADKVFPLVRDVISSIQHHKNICGEIIPEVFDVSSLGSRYIYLALLCVKSWNEEGNINQYIEEFTSKEHFGEEQFLREYYKRFLVEVLTLYREKQREYKLKIKISPKKIDEKIKGKKKLVRIIKKLTGEPDVSLEHLPRKVRKPLAFTCYGLAILVALLALFTGITAFSGWGVPEGGLFLELFRSPIQGIVKAPTVLALLWSILEFIQASVTFLFALLALFLWIIFAPLLFMIIPVSINWIVKLIRYRRYEKVDIECPKCGCYIKGYTAMPREKKTASEIALLCPRCKSFWYLEQTASGSHATRQEIREKHERLVELDKTRYDYFLSLDKFQKGAKQFSKDRVEKMTRKGKKMIPIYDQTWREHLKTGKVLEEFNLGDFKMVAIRVTQQFYPLIFYHYRLLCFPMDTDEPILALNLESTSLGTCFLSAFIEDKHLNYGPAYINMSYEEFKSWALSMIKEHLGI